MKREPIEASPVHKDGYSFFNYSEVRELEKYTASLEQKLGIAEEALIEIKEELQTYPISSTAKERSIGRCEYTAIEALNKLKEE